MKAQKEPNNLLAKLLEEKDKTANEMLKKVSENHLEQQRIANVRFEKCPEWSKDQDLESWKQIVEVWNQTHQNSPGNQKLMSILAAVQHHHLAEHDRLVFKTLSDKEFMEKVNDKENEVSKNIAEKCLKELELWYGKNKMEKVGDSYKSYKSLRQEDGERTM